MHTPKTLLLVAAAGLLAASSPTVNKHRDQDAGVANETTSADAAAIRKGLARQTSELQSAGDVYAEAEADIGKDREDSERIIVAEDETASGGSFVRTLVSEQSSLRIPVYVESTGDYYPWLSLRVSDGAACGLYMSVDAGADEPLVAADGECRNEWNWLPLVVAGERRPLHLTEGWHEVKIRARDAGLELDRIALANSVDTIPANAPAAVIAAAGEETDEPAVTQRKTMGAAAAMALPAAVAVPPPGFNRMGIVNYGSSNAGTAQTSLLQFQGPRYDIFIGGANPIAYAAPGTTYTTYRDMAALYPLDTWVLKQVAEKYGFKYEDMLLHMKTNYTFKDGKYGWAGMGRFDACETWYGGAATTAQSSKGVMLLGRDGVTWTDATTAAWNTTAADVKIENKMLLGYCEPFDQVEFQFATPASGGTAVAWEYWNGSVWAPLTVQSDTTTSLQKNGIVRFYPPSNWAVKSENGSRKKWWVRVSVGGAGTTPIASRILTDDFSVPGQPYTRRGWDATSSTRINVGNGPLEYNPTPPATATARFRYQARLLGLWTNNLHFGNAANIQNGVRTWARYIAESSQPQMTAIGANALFMDDAAGTPTGIVTPTGWLNYTEMAGTDHFGENVETYKAARDHLRSLMPGAKVCANSAVWDMVRQGDCFLVELASEVHKGGTFSVAVAADKRGWSSGSYDQLAPENNPNNTKGVYTAWDTAGSDFIANGSYVAWDRGNRGPITALAAYYIVANQNTRLAYNTEGWVYNKTDNFQYIDASPNFRTSAATGSNMTNGAVKYISGDFTNFPAEYKSSSSTLLVKIGTTGEFLPVWKVSNTQLATTDVMAFPYAAGTGIYVIREGNQSKMTLPPSERIVMFSNTFPAAGVNIGLPDTSGLNGGRRMMPWKTAAESGTAGGIQRRDFAGAIVLHAPGSGGASGAVLSNYGVAMPLGGTFYPLKSDGSTGAGITSIRLRTGEGAILLKAPVGGTITAPPATTTTPSATASFIRTDTTTAGSWKGVYGADGFNIINDAASYPSYVTVTPSGYQSYTWSASTTDTRGLQKGSSTATGRMAACWYSATSFMIDLAFNDQNTHQVAIYLIDWDRVHNRTEKVEIVDANNKVLDSRSVASFAQGQYLVWNLSGRVKIRVTNTNPMNAVVSGIFFR